MNRFQRVKQWRVLSRQWHLVDAKYQNVDILAKCIGAHLTGRVKPIYHPEMDCGDHVVIMNSGQIGMSAFNWKRVEYYYNRQYPKSRAQIPAWKIHEHDPKRVLWLEVYRSMSNDCFLRRRAIERLHIFADENVPDTILKNVTNQIQQVNSVPKKLTDFSEEEIANFPAVFDYPNNFIVNDEDAQLK